MLDRLRTSLHRAITTPLGDGLSAVRVPKDLARRANVLLGEPLCSGDELARRRDAALRLEALRAGRGPKPGVTEREAAPVMVYFEKDRNARLLRRIEDALGARGIGYTLLDVTGDETAKDYVMREAKVGEDELPVVFVAGTPVGGYDRLVEWDVSGRLDKAVRGG